MCSWLLKHRYFNLTSCLPLDPMASYTKLTKIDSSVVSLSMFLSKKNSDRQGFKRRFLNSGLLDLIRATDIHLFPAYLLKASRTAIVLP